MGEWEEKLELILPENANTKIQRKTSHGLDRTCVMHLLVQAVIMQCRKGNKS